MTKKSQVWKCMICGNIVEVLHDGADALVCCGKPMTLMKENSIDADVEKHRPVTDGKIVKVGSILHPMEEKHYIEWIEATDSDGKITKKLLKPNEEPVVEFAFNVVSARAYCNLHGLWK